MIVELLNPPEQVNPRNRICVTSSCPPSIYNQKTVVAFSWCPICKHRTYKLREIEIHAIEVAKRKNAKIGT